MKNNFREAREMRKMTQDEVADKIGVARATYGRYESGQRECSFETLRKLANLLCVSTDYLLGRNTMTEVISGVQATLLSEFDNLNSEGQTVMMTVLGSLKMSHPRKNAKKIGDVYNNGNNYGSVGGNFNPTVTVG